MRKVGKYEKMRKNAIMQTYITSLLCLVLCVTMFFGTTMAWFTDTTASEGNEMYVGTLDVDLKHATFSGGTQQKTNENMDLVDENYQVFKKIENGGIRWEPGYTAVEKFELTENGDLAFSYQMSIARTFAETGDEAQKAIAQAITVWSYVGDDAETVTTLPENFEELTAGQWEEIGTLYDVITKELPVFKGQMDKEAVTATKTEGQGEQQKTVEDPAKAYHLIALNMDKDYDGVISRDDNGKVTASVQGQKLDNITIKLVATQLPSEQDAFDNTYDAAANNFAVVSTAQELTDAIAAGKNVLLNNNIELTSTLTVANDVVLDLNGSELSGTCNAGQGHLIMVNNGATLDIKDSSSAQTGKITYAKGTSATGWTIDLEGKLNLYSGTIELTGEPWDIGYAVDVRPNAWGTNYAEDTVFHMYGGKIVSSDGAIRVASSSSDTYGNIVASFIMDGGEINADWDGIFVQQSNDAYDTLNVTINKGTVESELSPIRVYAPKATSVNAGTEKPMTITINGGNLSVKGTPDETRVWHTPGKIVIGGGITLEDLNKYTTITIA